MDMSNANNFGKSGDDRQSEIPKLLQEQEEILRGLQEAIKHLSQRLAPVLNQSKPTSKDSAEEPQYRTELSNKISKNNYRLADLIRDINSIYGGLEI